ncbi:MAG: ABC-2 family transporter protein [Oscillospiraceae bacterium]|nr:ABC-2 family transporter protein [Oscillospiraceae bacterium]
MLNELKKNIKILAINLKYNMAKEMENRTSFVSQVIFILLNNALYIVQWLVFYRLKSTIGGYSFDNILILWALGAASYGISHLFFENVYYIPELISNGKLDAYITQPLNVLWNVSVSKTKPSAFGDLLYGIVLAIISIGADFQKIFLFMLFSCLGAIILTSFSILASSLTFWIKRGEQIAHNLDFSIRIASLYPEGIFNNFIKVILYTIVPTGFIIYLPIRIILNFNLISMISVILFASFFALLAFYVFNKGLKKYSSSNLMSARI